MLNKDKTYLNRLMLPSQSIKAFPSSEQLEKTNFKGKTTDVSKAEYKSKHWKIQSLMIPKYKKSMEK